VKQLKTPLYEMTFLGMGIASGADIRHFFNALRSWGSFFHVAKRVTRHLLDLAMHGRGMQLVNGNALVAGLAKSAFDAGVDIRVNSPVVRLVTMVCAWANPSVLWWPTI
jgi:hypothetical protein